MKIVNVELQDIKHVDNTRGDVKEDLSELMKSIKKQGLMQPVTVTPNFLKGKQKFILVAGNRRFNAFAKLGRKTVPAVVNDSVKTLADLMIVNMTENIQRKDVSIFEQGRFVWKLNHECDMSLNEIAVRLGISRLVVTQLIGAYKNTPKEFRSKLTISKGSTKKGHVSLTAATIINGLKNNKYISHRDAQKLYKDVSANIYSSDHLKQMAKSLKEGGTVKELLDTSKRTTVITVKLPLYISERGDKQDMTKRVEAILYGESKERFTRPRL